MPSEPAWLDADEVVRINRRLVAATGEPYALRSRELLESALGRPSNIWRYDEAADLADLAAALLFGIARNHPFEQGNKRTAFAAAVIFVEANGHRFEPPDLQEIADAMVAVIEHHSNEDSFASLIRPYIVVV